MNSKSIYISVCISAVTPVFTYVDSRKVIIGTDQCWILSLKISQCWSPPHAARRGLHSANLDYNTTICSDQDEMQSSTHRHCCTGLDRTFHYLMSAEPVSCVHVCRIGNHNVCFDLIWLKLCYYALSNVFQWMSAACFSASTIHIFTAQTNLRYLFFHCRCLHSLAFVDFVKSKSSMAHV